MYRNLKLVETGNLITSNSMAFFQNIVKISVEDFDYLLELVSPIISKNDTNFRRAVSPSKRLAVTLRYLATGENVKRHVQNV